MVLSLTDFKAAGNRCLSYYFVVIGWDVTQLFQTHAVLPEMIHGSYLAQGNIGFEKADVGNTHPVKVEALSSAIIDCTTVLIPKMPECFRRFTSFSFRSTG